MTAAAQLGPDLQPNVIVVGVFVNDFVDAETGYEELRDSIGFDRPDPTGIAPSLRWAHISKYLRYNVTEPILSLGGIANRTGYLLGQFDSFEPGAIASDTEGYRLTLNSMQEIATMAPDARRVMVVVPASIQVCQPADLDYYPANVDVSGLDMDQPQRAAGEIAAATGMEFLDLRDSLNSLPECPYHPTNTHWTPAGHEIVATVVAAALTSG